MITRITVAVALALLAGCGSDKKEAPRANADLGVVQPLVERLAADPAPFMTRQPIARPGANASENGYAKAGQVARGLLASRPPSPDAVFEATGRPWAAAPEAMRRLGADARSGEVASLVSAGAAEPEGRAIGEVEKWAEVAAIVIAWALETATAGQRADASWKLLAVVQLGHDMARGRRTSEAQAGLSVAQAGARALRAVLTQNDAQPLPADELAGLLDACTVMLDNRVMFADAWLLDLRYQEQQLLADSAGATADRVATLGGLRDALAGLRDHHLHGSGRQTRLLAARQEAWGKGDERAGVDDIGRWELANAELSATCVVAALSLDRLDRGTLAPDLAALSPQPLAEPILSQPWEYIDDGAGGRLLRSGAVTLGGKPARVEIAIPAR